jgi:hypothetical protein
LVLVSIFLAPRAVALGAMLIALPVGAVDVAFSARPYAQKLVAVASAACMVTLAWSAPIVWISFGMSADRPFRAMLVAIAGVVAVGPPLGFGYQTLRSEAGARALTAAVTLSAAFTTVGVFAWVIVHAAP